MKDIVFVTVTKDNFDDLQSTLFSINNFSKVWDISLIVVDSSSNHQQTLEVIGKNITSIRLQKSMLILEDAPKGVYHAMNKAIPHLSGKYVCFMNSGDVIHPLGFGKMMKQASVSTSEKVYYGHPIWLDGTNKVGLKLPFGLHRLRIPFLGRMPNHQCMLVPVSAHSHLYYNFDKYPIAADLDVKLALLRKLEFIDTRLNVTLCKPGGISQQINSFSILFKRAIEYSLITGKYYGLLTLILSWIFFVLWHSRKLLARSFVA